MNGIKKFARVTSRDDILTQWRPCEPRVEFNIGTIPPGKDMDHKTSAISDKIERPDELETVGNVHACLLLRQGYQYLPDWIAWIPAMDPPVGRRNFFLLKKYTSDQFSRAFFFHLLNVAWNILVFRMFAPFTRG